MTVTGWILLVMMLCLVGLIGWLLLTGRGPGAGEGTTVVVRCLAGHVYTTTWASRSLRLGAVHWRYCPAGRHWTLVTPVRPEDMTPAGWRMARRYHDDSVR